MVKIGNVVRLFAFSMLVGCSPAVRNVRTPGLVPLQGSVDSMKYGIPLDPNTVTLLNDTVLSYKSRFGCVGVGVELVPLPAMTSHARNIAALRARSNYLNVCLGESSGDLGSAVGRPVNVEYLKLAGAYACFAYSAGE